jgi:hypothetical protein
MPVGQTAKHRWGKGMMSPAAERRARRFVMSATYDELHKRAMAELSSALLTDPWLNDARNDLKGHVFFAQLCLQEMWVRGKQGRL